MKPWLILLTLLQLGDIITTLIGGIEMEANPYALWFWINVGFWSVVVAKATHIGLFVLVWKFFNLMPKVWLKALFRTVLVAECLIPMTTIVTWNLWCLLKGV